MLGGIRQIFSIALEDHALATSFALFRNRTFAVWVNGTTQHSVSEVGATPLFVNAVGRDITLAGDRIQSRDRYHVFQE